MSGPLDHLISANKRKRKRAGTTALILLAIGVVLFLLVNATNGNLGKSRAYISARDTIEEYIEEEDYAAAYECFGSAGGLSQKEHDLLAAMLLEDSVTKRYFEGYDKENQQYIYLYIPEKDGFYYYRENSLYILISEEPLTYPRQIIDHFAEGADCLITYSEMVFHPGFVTGEDGRGETGVLTLSCNENAKNPYWNCRQIDYSFASETIVLHCNDQEYELSEFYR